MEKISVLVVEDQLLVAQQLKAILEDHDFDVIDTVDKGEEALALLKTDLPDLIIMDIQLAGDLDGVETASQIQSEYNIPIIYLSDHIDEETVDRAKLTYPANYLSKPFRPADLLRSLEIAFLNTNRNRRLSSTKLKDRIFIRIDNQNSKMIPYDDIIYLEADRSYCSIITASETYTLSNNMGIIASQMESSDFKRVSRKHIININKVMAINGNMISLDHGHELQMSKTYRDEVLKYFNIIK